VFLLLKFVFLAAANEDDEEEINVLLSSPRAGPRTISAKPTLPCPTQRFFSLMGAHASFLTFSADPNTATLAL
jgi:hypothetical protein